MRGRSRRRRIFAWAGGSLGGVVVVAVAALLIWSQLGVMQPEAEPLDAVTEDGVIEYADTSAAITLSPAEGGSEAGLVFIPGAKVDAAAYANRLAGLVVEEGMTVVITRPWLNLAFFDPRPLDAFTALAPGVDTWIVGGHSLGGVRACGLGGDADALVLFASYCANDLSASGMPALSIGGGEDGLSTPEKIADAADLLPAGAVLVEIDGASHASFGDYGAQAGDGVATISDAEMNAEVVELVSALVRRTD
ncbi:alpha/beta hydrolase [Microbacterium suaedae]|uniref:alpha/beta hydrolase n=1 Tax=Microbacterium suaedae TaxID=2067813 RepID=UPI000DAE1D8E|nr:alpha/beta hydrolase [Microbacterium suaedae]